MSEVPDTDKRVQKAIWPVDCSGGSRLAQPLAVRLISDRERIDELADLFAHFGRGAVNLSRIPRTDLFLNIRISQHLEVGIVKVVGSERNL